MKLKREQDKIETQIYVVRQCAYIYRSIAIFYYII